MPKKRPSGRPGTPVLLAALAALLLAWTPVVSRGLAGADPDAGPARAAGGRGGGPAVLLNELLPAPGTAFAEEWVELFNNGSAPADLGGWSLDDLEGAGSRPYVIPNGTRLPAGGFLVLGGRQTGVALNNDGDTVRLLEPSGALADSYTYGASTHDASFGRYPDGGPRWRPFETPTPGASNGAPAPPGPADGSVVLVQVYYHAFPGRGNEFVAVANPDDSAAVDLSGWSVLSGSSSVTFPDGTTLGPGATVFVTGNASDFLSDTGHLPDLETRGSRPDVGQAGTSGSWPALGNEGGAVELRDSRGDAVDAFAWGRPPGGTGWAGPPAVALGAGEVARRLRDGSGRWQDSNTSADWPASGALPVGRSDFGERTFGVASVSAFVSPDCSFAAVAGELDSARSSILVAAYQFESWPLARRLEAACLRGVAVSVLLEGAPVEGVSDQERAVARLLSDSGARVAFLASPPGRDLPDRYSYMHAKYCVIDNSTCIVSSENWKESGLPSVNTAGNRGWGAVVRDPGLAGFLSEVFRADANPAMRDVMPYSPEGGRFGPPPAGFVPEGASPGGSFRPRFPAERFGPGASVRPVLSPDTSLLENGSVLGLLRSASRTLDIEQLSCPPDWDSGGSEMPNAYLEAAVGAARRGVRVRLLLDGTYLDPEGSGKANSDALNLVLHVAAAEGLDLAARFAAVPGTLKLHNKGVVVDGERVLVSSLNWGRNSVRENREVGLIIEGAGVAGYFQRVFDIDWNLSAPPPRPGGGSEGDATFLRDLPARALFLTVLLAAVAVTVLLRRALSRRRRY
ncbi:MAG: hypothetical protein FJ149_08300 [Euryarchaeota archaeon]|nr:hypothetical protein [Euryarchaeota archaeon]